MSSLEKLVQVANHYLSWTGESIRSDICYIFTHPTGMRRAEEREEDEEESEQINLSEEGSNRTGMSLLEEAIVNSTHCVMFYSALAAAYSEPIIFKAILGTNLISYGYERWRSAKRKEQAVENRVLGEETESLSLLQRLQNVKESIFGVPEAVKQYILRLPEQFILMKDSCADQISDLSQEVKSYFASLPRRIVRRTTVHLLASILAAVPAIGHYYLLSKPQLERFDPEKVNIQVQDCSLQVEDKTYRFSLIGELHVYNYSSAEAACHYIQQQPPEILLSEGVSQTRFGANGEIPPEENLVFKIYRITRNAGGEVSGFNHPSISDFAATSGIPVVYLERDDPNTGIREGMKLSEALILFGSTAMMIYNSAYVYFPLVIASRFAKNLTEDMTKVISFFPSSGIVDARNRIMVTEALKYQEEKKALIRVGGAHIRGMKEEYAKYGSLECREVHLAEFMKPERCFEVGSQ